MFSGERTTHWNAEAARSNVVSTSEVEVAKENQEQIVRCNYPRLQVMMYISDHCFLNGPNVLQVSPHCQEGKAGWTAQNTWATEGVRPKSVRWASARDGRRPNQGKQKKQINANIISVLNIWCLYFQERMSLKHAVKSRRLKKQAVFAKFTGNVRFTASVYFHVVLYKL